MRYNEVPEILILEYNRLEKVEKALRGSEWAEQIDTTRLNLEYALRILLPEKDLHKALGLPPTDEAA